MQVGNTPKQQEKFQLSHPIETFFAYKFGGLNGVLSLFPAAWLTQLASYSNTNREA